MGVGLLRVDTAFEEGKYQSSIESGLWGGQRISPMRNMFDMEHYLDHHCSDVVTLDVWQIVTSVVEKILPSSLHTFTSFL